MINYLIDGQSLKIVNKVAAGGTYNYIEAEAIFSEEWDGLDKKLHFKQGETSHIAPMSNDKVDETAGLNLGAGTWETWVSGIKSEEKSIANLNALTWTLKETTYWATELKALDLLTAANYTEDTLANVKAGTTANTMALSEGVLYIYNNNTETSPSGALTYSALKQRITTQRQLINVYAADDGTDEGSGFPEFSVTEAERIIAMAQAAYNAKITSASATVDSNVGTPAVNVVLGGSEGARSLTFAFTNMKGETGEEGEKGEIGDTGVGISSITLKESTASGNTYTVTLTDSSTYDFTAPKGPAGNDGEDGEDGVSPGITIAEITGGHSVTITDAEHPGGQTFNVMDGDASDFDELANRPKYNGSTMTHSTNIPEVKSAEWNAKYEKPATGIPSTDMSSAVQTSLDKADSALQEHQSLAAYRTSSAQDTIDSGKVDKVNGKGLSTNDYTDADKAKVANAITEHQSLAAYRTSANQDTIDNALDERLDTIESEIPSQASPSNQLADKNFVNSSIATNTANYISNNGEPFTSVAQLESYSGAVTNNDYAFVTGIDSHGNTYFDRYKASVSGTTVAWAKEFRLNNSSFTAAQWAAISSGITDSEVAKIHEHSNMSVLNGITSLLVGAWNGAVTWITTNGTNILNHIADTVAHITGAERTKWNGYESTITSQSTEIANLTRDKVSFTDMPTWEKSGPVKVNAVFGIYATNDGTLYTLTRTASDYETCNDGFAVGKKTLDNVSTAKGWNNAQGNYNAIHGTDSTQQVSETVAWEVGAISHIDGSFTKDTWSYRSPRKYDIRGLTSTESTWPTQTGVAAYFYDANKNYLGRFPTSTSSFLWDNNALMVAYNSRPEGACYVAWKSWNANYPTIKHNRTAPIHTDGLSDKVAELESDARLDSLTTVLSNPFKTKRFSDHLFINESVAGVEDNITIPNQSIFNIQTSKRLGFDVIEFNVKPTSDGFICIHGVSNKFGLQCTSLDSTDITNVAISSVTTQWVKTNVRYKSKYTRYRVAPPTLEEALTECKKLNLIPIVGLETYNATAVQIADSIMGKDNYIYYTYDESRGNISAPIMTFKSFVTESEILDFCHKMGKPLIYTVANPTAFTDAELESIITNLHKEGFLVGIAYCYEGRGTTEKFFDLGADMAASADAVPEFEEGNLCNLAGEGSSFTDFTHNGTVTDGVLVLNTGNTVTPANAVSSVFLGKSCLSITYEGTISITMGTLGNWYNFVNTSPATRTFTMFFMEKVPTFTLYARTDGTKIYNISFKASKV